MLYCQNIVEQKSRTLVFYNIRLYEIQASKYTFNWYRNECNENGFIESLSNGFWIWIAIYGSTLNVEVFEKCMPSKNIRYVEENIFFFFSFLCNFCCTHAYYYVCTTLYKYWCNMFVHLWSMMTAILCCLLCKIYLDK